MVDVGARAIGARVRRVEDPRILTGRGQYVDDVVLPGMLHAAFRRSQVPHGRILSIDVSEARQLPGVVAVYTGDDIAGMTTGIQAGSFLGVNMMPGIKSPTFHALATDKVRHVGDPIALVIAESRYIAEDALELIVEDIDMLDPIVTYEHALDPSRPPVFDELGDNINMTSELELGDIDAAFAKADRVVRATLQVHRHQPVPMECRGTIASWDPEAEQLTIYAATQSPHVFRMLLPAHLGIPMERIRVIARDVGGGFGLKGGLFREDIALAAATKDLGRPIKWTEDRLEHLASAGQAREEMADLEAAVTDDGRLLGVKMDLKVNTGAYPCDPFPGAIFAFAIITSFQGPSKLEALSAKATAVFSNKATYVAYRGPWATGDFLRERFLDVVAHELGIDPLEVRRRNYVIRDEPPLAMLTGRPFVGVTTRESVDQAAELIDWENFRQRQAAARQEGRYLGIGMAAYLEGAPGPRAPGDNTPDPIGGEKIKMYLDSAGHLFIVTQQQPHGQSHETTLAQVAADELGIPFEDITVLYGDTDISPPRLVGTGGSRAATMANGVVLHASRELREKVLSLAAEQLEANPQDLELVGGVVSVRGTPTVRLSLADIAQSAGADDLTVTRDWDGGQSGWSGGAHCCIVEVDPDTGLVRFERYVVVEDCGVAINPAIVEGQVRGAVAQAVGAVLLEHAAYDEDGQFVASSFMDYLLPTSALVPPIEIHHVDTVPTDPDVNFRGIGEGGMIVAPAAITNAIEDALVPFGAHVYEQHLPPARILEMIGVS
jgi:carbon-monoxide dehydrogenase large subunit